MRRRGYFLPGFIALAVLVAIGAAVGAGDLTHPAAKTVEGPAVAAQIALGIETAQGLDRAPAVRCPPTEPVREGLHFTCTEAAGGAKPGRVVDVVEIDSRGHLRWSFASPAQSRPPG